MRIIIEEYPYKASDVRDVLKGLSPLENVKGEVSVSYVGYFFNTKLNDCVFILPKVLLNENCYLFEDIDSSRHLRPEQIINFDKPEVDALLKPGERDFIYEFAVWIYRAIAVYNQTDNDIVYTRKILEAGKGGKRRRGTFLDIIVTMLRFNRENQNFFMHILRNIHSGYNKINWNKTISNTTALVNNNLPVYTNPVNKKRQINFDEELLIIFFSILNYIHVKFGFPVILNLGYELIKGKKFESYLKGHGRLRLKQIKYKYFSDKALQIWKLCYDFFERSSESVNTTLKEYLLAKNFNIVFEAIINELIGDKNVPDELKNQRDGKIVDHIFSYKGLTTHDEDKDIYYIGDSKYYKLGNKIGDNSIYKQYTYARNLIQWNLGLFLPAEENESQTKTNRRKALSEQQPKYRDDTTEGYNIVPNFFISAKLTDGISFSDHIEPRDDLHIQRQFANRLFDRDTLLISHYNVNFLYIVALYARNKAHEKAAWKQKVQKEFREKTQDILSRHFNFYAMTPKLKTDIQRFFPEHFKQVLGKVYAPFDDNRVFAVALDNRPISEKENEETLSLLRQYFYVVDNPIGKDPTYKLQAAVAKATPQIVAADDKGKFFLAQPTREVNPDQTPFTNGAATEFVAGRKVLEEGLDFSDIKYYVPVVDRTIFGFYDVTSIGVAHIEGVVPPYRMKFTLGEFHLFPEGKIKYGIDVNAVKGVVYDLKAIEKYRTNLALRIVDKI